ncbi:hypothetical protein NPIL_419301 [Nephila pilipes]|uniref:Uncharacterized protein n=1 Tax=Nephila pilipes TaxID=299642 RepID=A0A8X6UB26_NEPPI|nr:hypothetical protein NPIL_419301 [Nephila pilipes]
MGKPLICNKIVIRSIVTVFPLGSSSEAAFFAAFPQSSLVQFEQLTIELHPVDPSMQMRSNLSGLHVVDNKIMCAAASSLLLVK